MMTNKIMDHEEYPKSLKGKTDLELHCIIKDASLAIKALPENPHNGFYADEVNYCCNELFKRRSAKLMKHSYGSNEQRAAKFVARHFTR